MMRQHDRQSSLSRRSFLRLSTAVSTAAGLGIVTESMLAWPGRKAVPKDAVIINQNENPLGPSEAARAAATAMVQEGGRYQWELTEDLLSTFAKIEGLKPDYVHAFPGSSDPLHYAVMTFTSPTRSYVTADPGYEAGMFTSERSGARVVKVPLTKTYAHDVKAMLSAAPDAGVFYICSPNNPTGTLTPHSDIEYLLEKKPKGSIVLVDEAYLHFCDAPSVLDLAKADKEIIVLRTFSKIYGMAGLRCGLAIGRPDLLEKVHNTGGWNFMPVPAVAAASASLNDPKLVPERRRINAAIRAEVFEWLGRNRYAYIPSQSNCFLLDTKRAGKDVMDAMERQGVIIGRVWPVMPTWVRITVGTRPEMDRFQAAFKRVMDGTAVGMGQREPRLRRNLDDFAFIG
jgi:histidinol-phosphate aminotransferase